jgi:hypothetical protein
VFVTFYVGITCAQFCRRSIGRGGASQTRRWLTLLAVGWRPLDVWPSAAGLTRGPRVPAGLVTPSRVTPYRGCASSDGGLIAR